MPLTSQARLPLSFCALLWAAVAGAAEPPIVATRSPSSPIITSALLPGDDGASINGPSMIRVPDWVQKPLGKYYLYFAHHAGKYLRLAYADQPEGPWKFHAGGVLQLADQRDLHLVAHDHVEDLVGVAAAYGQLDRRVGRLERAQQVGQQLGAMMAAMQAQVEPHFLFNTLASIDHLIETDPPRASRMQKSLIALLRATLPNLRDDGAQGPLRTLGQEADVIVPYLDIMKVRMEDRLQAQVDIP